MRKKVKVTNHHTCYGIIRKGYDGTFGIMNKHFLFMSPPKDVMLYATEQQALDEALRWPEAQRVGIKFIPISLTWETEEMEEE
jgi:hypothetical protein